MATEEGIVIAVGASTARVRTIRSGACDTCASRGACSTASGGKEMEVEALNVAAAKLDDRVVVRFDSASLLKISFLLYIFPVLSMIAGAVLGHLATPKLGFNGSTLSVVCGIAFFLLAFVFIKSREKKMAGKDTYRPKVVRILKRF